MVFLQPVDIGRNRRRACLDAAVIGLDIRLGRDGLACGIVEISADIIVERALIALQSQRIVATLIDDLLSDRTLAVQRVGGHDRALQRQHLQQRRHGGDLVGLGVRGDLRQHHALLAAPGADHVQGRLAVGAIERSAQHFAICRHHTLTLFGETLHRDLPDVRKSSRPCENASLLSKTGGR